VFDHPTRTIATATGICAALLLPAACGSSGGSSAPATEATEAAAPVIDPGDGGHYTPRVDPADFVATIDNRYFPLRPGSRWEYEGVSDGEPERDVVVVTNDRHPVMGVSTVVVRDTVSRGGQVVEDTRDWYAQDRAGNVWYFGEAVQSFKHGQLESTDGSFEAGVGGALPGIVMPAHPIVGHAYRQEYLKGEAEDMGQIVQTDAHTDVPLGAFDAVVVTRDWNPLEPDVIEQKRYAPGVGVVMETTEAGGSDTSSLVAFSPGT
jgi:hypothetical protein